MLLQVDQPIRLQYSKQIQLLKNMNTFFTHVITCDQSVVSYRKLCFGSTLKQSDIVLKEDHPSTHLAKFDKY
jgi:hypothetical protein